MRMRMKAKAIGWAVVALLVGGAALAQTQRQAAEHPAQLHWGPPPPGLPSGARMAVLAGNPTKPGLFTVRLRAPEGYRVMPHHHPTDEDITVVSGTMRMGHGDRFAPDKAETLTTGSFMRIPAGSNHFMQTRGESVVQISSMGPFQIVYVNPSDDPRHGRAKR